MKYLLFAFLLILRAGISYGQCSEAANAYKNLNTDVNLSAQISCVGGNVVIVEAGGTGSITFDISRTYNSFDVTFQNGEKPIEFIIPAGITITITNGMSFHGMPNKDKFITVNGTLNVGTTLDFGGIAFDVGGSGSIVAPNIIGAGAIACAAGGCPKVTVSTCTPASVCAPGGPLPIVMNYFKAYLNDDNIILNWQTASELNNDFFTIERSGDEIDFEVVAIVSGAGTSMTALNYTYTDKHPINGVSYYRLTQTDYDGKFEVFSPVSVSYLNESDIKIGSNPTAKKVTISMNGEMGLGNAKIYNVIGVLVKTFEITDNYTTVNVSDIPNGAYILVVSAGKTQITKKIMIK